METLEEPFVYGFKMGGTTHESTEFYHQQAKLLREATEAGKKCFAVHSAISRGGKQNGTTERIKAAINLAQRGKIAEARDLLQIILCEHDEIADAVIEDATKRNRAKEIIRARVLDLDGFMPVLKMVGPRADPRLIDGAIGIGESFSTAIAAANYQQHGIEAEEVDLTYPSGDFNHEDGELLSSMASIFGNRVEEVLRKGSVPVVTGHGSDLYSLFGRGYSDAMSILLMNHLTDRNGSMGLLHIVKNGVAGVLSADPRIVPTGTRLVPEISFSELGRLQAEVVHPMLLPYIMAHVRLRVRNIANLDEPGTLVTHEEKKISGKRFKAINVLGAGENSIAVINVTTPHMVHGSGYVAKIASALADRTIGMINTTPDSVRLTTVISTTDDIEDIRRRLSPIGEVSISDTPDTAQVIVVGRELEDVALSEMTAVVEEVLNRDRKDGVTRIMAPDFLEYDSRRPNYAGFGVPKKLAGEVARALHERFM